MEFFKKTNEISTPRNPSWWVLDINFLMWPINKSKQRRMKARNNACPW